MRPEVLFPWAFPFLFIASWLAMSVLISHVSGWWQLAQSYRSTEPFTGKQWWFQNGSLRRATHYGGCLQVGGNDEGLHLSVFFLFRLRHPPLFFPWSDISVSHERRWFTRLACLRFSKEPSVLLCINERLAMKIQSAFPDRWPGFGE